VLQKYDSPKLVATFLADPQRRLKYVEQVDRVVRHSGAARGLGGVTATPTTLRKLYQPSHFRHYLVTCALHCDAPGLPPVDREQVCQAGFVIRKRSYKVGGPDAKAGRAKLMAVNAARRAVASIDGHIAAARSAPNIGGVRLAALQVQRDGAVHVLTDAVAELQRWAKAEGVQRELSGWFPTDHDGEGRWQATSELPAEVAEDVFPLYPLVVPKDAPHDAAGQTVYFGLVPTGSADVDLDNKRLPRFDDGATYEIRCFVRRHAPNCLNEKGEGTADCRGQVVWSEPTEAFGLAAHFDLRGTANRPINVQMPDLLSLKAEAGKFPAGVQFRTPPFSQATGDGPSNGDFQICSFSIPLITIVAMFVFQLFLPIVVLLFQLWFLLLLKFCIPPEIDLDVGLDAALKLDPGSVGFDAAFDASINLGSLDKALGLFGPATDMADNSGVDRVNDFKGLPRPARRTFLRQLYGKDALAQPVSDLDWAERVEWPEVLPV
jgi:hypothetical protein